MLHAEEEQLAQWMAPDRRREFTVGRVTAREALRAAGAPDVAVMVGNAGEPLWPESWVGSLSHTHAHAAVLVAAASRYRAVGIDLDDGRPLGAESAADLMTRDEVQSVIEAGIATDVEGAQRFVFSAKEAVYKCQYPLTGCGDLDFPDVRLEHAHNVTAVPLLRASWVGSADTHADLKVEVFPLLIHRLLLAVAVVLQSPCRETFDFQT
jgi:4'-phosphopantetheinyl transferase EntD